MKRSELGVVVLPDWVTSKGIVDHVRFYSVETGRRVHPKGRIPAVRGIDVTGPGFRIDPGAYAVFITEAKPRGGLREFDATTVEVTAGGKVDAFAHYLRRVMGVELILHVQSAGDRVTWVIYSVEAPIPHSDRYVTIVNRCDPIHAGKLRLDGLPPGGRLRLLGAREEIPTERIARAKPSDYIVLEIPESPKQFETTVTLEAGP